LRVGLGSAWTRNYLDLRLLVDSLDMGAGTLPTALATRRSASQKRMAFSLEAYAQSWRGLDVRPDFVDWIGFAHG
jgi:hypothetical protein